MKLEIELGGKKRSVELAHEGSRLNVSFDGRCLEADAVEVAPGTYSILFDGRAFEVRVQPAVDGLRVHTGGLEFTARVLDPRVWRGRRGGVLEAEGRQEIAAPMPGKVVRVLVKPGQAVEAGAGLLVIEAMKMQNEVRSPKTGTVERLMVREGQAVTAGEVLAVVG